MQCLDNTQQENFTLETVWKGAVDKFQATGSNATQVSYYHWYQSL